jgi:glucose-1-phosphate cytidylyltransferase
MKTVILAGGLGTRLSEETVVMPKPMVEVGGKPILWHILNMYSGYDFREFVIALGYKGEVIKDYFLNFYALNNDLSIDLARGSTKIHDRNQIDWIVHLVDTGSQTQTGGRLKRLRHWIGRDTFMMTYGDGVADVNIKDIVAFHRAHGKLATVTTVRPPARFGNISFEGSHVAAFTEKPQTGEGWVNGGFFVLEPEVLDYIDGDDIIWERDPLERLAQEKQLMAYRHHGFWQPMDTLREKRLLEDLWQSGKAPWMMHQ